MVKTRMHSSRMRTGRSLTVRQALLPGGVCLSACWDTPQEQTPPWEQTPPPPRRQPPGADTPQSRHPPGADTPPKADTHPQSRHPPPPPRADTPSANRMTDTSKNITLATTSLRPVIIHFIPNAYEISRWGVWW